MYFLTFLELCFIDIISYFRAPLFPRNVSFKDALPKSEAKEKWMLLEVVHVFNFKMNSEKIRYEKKGRNFCGRTHNHPLERRRTYNPIRPRRTHRGSLDRISTY